MPNCRQSCCIKNHSCKVKYKQLHYFLCSEYDCLNHTWFASYISFILLNIYSILPAQAHYTSVFCQSCQLGRAPAQTTCCEMPPPKTHTGYQLPLWTKVKQEWENFAELRLASKYTNITIIIYISTTGLSEYIALRSTGLVMYYLVINISVYNFLNVIVQQ